MELLQENILLLFALLLITGVIFGKIAYKLKVPGIIGHIAAGILIGPYFLGLISVEALHGFEIITDFALGLITVTVGSHLSYKNLHNSLKRMTSILVAELLLIPLFVTLSLHFIGGLPLPACLILSAIAIGTAPATIIHSIRENRAKGLFVKTLISEVALNNVFCVLMFELASYISIGIVAPESLSSSTLLFPPYLLLLGKFICSILLGLVIGFLLIFVINRVKFRTGFFAFCFIAILLTKGLEEMFNLSPLLACLVLGIVIGNFAPKHLNLKEIFKDVEFTIFAAFFTIAGAHLKLNYLVSSGLFAAVYVVSRGVGKAISPFIASRFFQFPQSVSRWLGLALLPQAGMAVGLILALQNNEVLQNKYPYISTIVLTAIVCNEIIGPILTKVSLVKSGEVDKDRSRLIEFLHEEFIFIDNSITDTDEALVKMAGFLSKTYNIKKGNKERLYENIQKLEKEFIIDAEESTAISHFVLDLDKSIMGVIGIFKKGISFNQAPDQIVNIIVLVTVPANQYQKLLQINVGMNSILKDNPKVKEAIINSESAAEVYELLTIEEFDKFNYYIQE